MVTETIEKMREEERERERELCHHGHHMYIYNINGVECNIACRLAIDIREVKQVVKLLF